MKNRMGLYLSQIQAVDIALCLMFNRTSQRDWIREFFCVISRLGNGLFWYAVMLGTLLYDRQDGVVPCLHMMGAGLAGTLLYKGIKVRASRPRPSEVSMAISPGLPPLDQFSFPSGHTLHAVVFSMVALSYYPMLSWLLIPFTMLTAISRLVLGLHYPTDVLAGAVLGVFIASLSFML